MPNISFRVLAHDLASRTFRKVGNAAMTMAAKVRAADAAMGRFSGADRMRVSMARASVGVGRLNRAFSTLTGGNLSGEVRVWFRAILAALTVMPPVLGAAALGVGALGASIVAVTPGLIGLGGALVGVGDRLRGVIEGTRQGTPALNQAADAFERMRGAWERFLDATETNVAGVFTELFNTVSTVLPRIEGLVNSYAETLARFFRDMRQDMAGPEFQQAVNWFERVGTQAFENLLTSVRNVGEGLFYFSRELERLGVDVDFTWLKNGTASFKEWARTLRNNKDFQDFVEYVKEQWPKIKRIFENLRETFSKLWEGMEPVASDVLDALEDVTEATSKISPAQWEAIGRSAIVLGLGLKAVGAGLAAIRGVMLFVTFVSAVGRLGGMGLRGIGLGLVGIGTGLGKVGGASRLLNVAKIGGLATTLGRLATTPWTAIAAGLLAIGAGLGWLYVNVPDLRPIFNQLVIGPIVKLTANIIKARDRLPGLMAGLVTNIATGFANIKEAMGAGLQALHGDPGGALARFVSVVSRNFTRAWSLAKQATATGTARIMARVSELVEFNGRALGRFKRLWESDTGKAMRGAFQIVRTQVGNIIRRVRTGLSSARRVGVQQFKRLRTGIGAAMKAAFRVVRDNMGQIRTRASSAARGARTAVVSAFRALGSRAGSAVRGLARTVSSRMRTVRTALGRAAGKAAGVAGRLVGSFTRIGGAAKGAARLIGGLADAIRGLKSKTISVTANVTGNLLGNLSKLGGFLAAGGPAKRGVPYVVGEEGPELFVPNRSGTVVPNHGLEAAAGGASSRLLAALLAKQEALQAELAALREAMEEMPRRQVQLQRQSGGR